MQVKCYDCGRLVSSGEAVKQNERNGRAGGGGYSKHGWGAGAGSWNSAGKSYWLCIDCDRQRVANRRFWRWVFIGIVLGTSLVSTIVYLIVRSWKK